MKPWTLVATTAAPDGKTVSLHEHDGVYSIRVDGAELMSTRSHASEEKLAQLACAHLKGRSGARVLIGGLGFGFTLQAALAALSSDARVTVAEILAAVIEWNRMVPVSAAAIQDPRVTVVHADVAEVIRARRGAFDAVILDIDNGPAALSTAGNGRLYEVGGLREVRAALRPGGVAAFWSAAPDAAFERMMGRAGLRAEVHTARAHSGGGRRHTLFVGRV